MLTPLPLHRRLHRTSRNLTVERHFYLTRHHTNIVIFAFSFATHKVLVSFTERDHILIRLYESGQIVGEHVLRDEEAANVAYFCVIFYIAPMHDFEVEG